MRNLLIALILVLVITLCFFLFNKKFDHNTSPLKDFESLQTTVLSGEDIKLATDSILYRPYNFQIFDTLAIFNDNTGDAAFTVINLKTGELIKKFAFSGDKPSEFDINAICMNNAINNKSTFTLLQINPPCKIFRYSWDSLLGDRSYKPTPFYYTHNFTYSSAFLLNDSMIFGQISFSRFDDKMYGIVNTFSNKLITGIYLPRTGENLSFSYNDSIYYKWLKVVLNGKICHRPGSTFEFAFFSMDGAVVQIFDIDKDYKFSMKYEKAYYLPSFQLVKGPGYIKPEMKPDNRLGFNDIAVTEDKIYTLFNGQSANEIKNEDRRSDIVLVYDWQGKPSQRIKLDKKCGRIFIDETNPKILYALYGPMYTNIVKYRLP